MLRGTTLFICTECKKVFLAPDVEYNAMALSVPMPCERCGSMRTLPMKLDYFVLSDELNPNEPLEKQLLNYSIYESIWKRMGKPDIEQADTPEEQYRTGMKYLDDKALSIRSSDTALYWLMKAARQGHAKAQYLVGVLLCGRCSAPAYLQHPPFCYTEGTVYQWMSKAAEQGLPEAMCYLGNMYRAGYLVEKNFGKAFAWHLKAAKSDCAASKYAIACMYEQGEGVEQNTFRALRWCWKAALHGYAEAQLHLGIVYESTGKERHFHTAATFYQQAAQQKSAEAWLPEVQLYIEFTHEKVKNILDFHTAFTFCQQIAQQKSAEAWQRLASLYEMGKGVKQDFEKAWECCLNAWEAGSEEAYKEAKRLLDEGLAHPDVSVVMEWYRKCIDRGHKEMWYDLGKIYHEGKGIERNLKEARQCYLFAARTAHVAEAEYALGCMYERGEGVTANLQEAISWYQKAAKQGHTEAEAACRRLKEHGDFGKTMIQRT